MIDLNRPLDLDDGDALAFLSGIQGNIIKGHGRSHTAHLLLRVDGHTAAARSAAWEFCRQWVKSASALNKESTAWRALGQSGGVFSMFLLSASGYLALGYQQEDIPAPARDVGYQAFHDDYFKFGMKRQSEIPRRYNDPAADAWENPYQGEIHAMILLADNHRGILDKAVEEVSRILSPGFTVLTVERGDVLKKDFPRGNLTIEHFGYQDGVSQPVMIQQDLTAEINERGSARWNPGAPLSLTLVEEPGRSGGYGSFMVFRKLEQDVRGFSEALGQLSIQHGIPADHAGALAVGRHQDGTPLLPVASSPYVDGNDFNYGQDPSGGVCPFHAHIRKTNPRGDIQRVLNGSEEFEKARRIARRGITYGERPDLNGGGDPPSAGVGLLFMCFQANLDQFVIQQEGADDNGFVRPGTGVDAVIGQNPDPQPQTWPSTGTARFTMANFVKMLGGEYFFAPSMRFLSTFAPLTSA